MAQVSSKLRSIEGGFMHYCPACEEIHAFWVSRPEGYNWQFNDDLEAPTVSPSISIRYIGGDGIPVVCHYFLTNGKLSFGADCTHKYRNDTIDLPNLPEWLQD